MKNNLKTGLLIISMSANILLTQWLTEKENNQSTEPETILVDESSTIDNETESVIHLVNDMEFKTQDDVYALGEDNEYFRYLPLKAHKNIFNGVEYFYLHDTMGAMYLYTDGQLEEGKNYIAEVGRYTDTLYGVKESDFKFDEVYEQNFIYWLQEDKENANDLYREENNITEL